MRAALTWMDRLPKNSTADAAPNGSEMAYLLYYASTRQEKLPKVGAFLEKKTVSDVSHWQSARVHVTLQILTAMLEHAEIQRPQSFAVLAPTVCCSWKYLYTCIVV